MPTPNREALKPAVKRFNRWQFIEAQSLLKEIAEEAQGTDVEFLNALAEVANGFAKIWHKGGEPHTMVSLLTKGCSRASRFKGEYLGLDLSDFHDSLTGCLEEAKRWRRGDTEIFNRDLIPRLEFIDPDGDDD